MPFTRSPVVLLANSGTWLNQALDSMLEPLGYRVVFAGSGRELLDRASAARPDVVIMDANLQDLDSVAVCRSLRQHRAVSWHTPIFLVTSTPATKQQRLAALEAGAWDYLSLVVNAEELALKLDAFVRVKLETDRALEEAAVEPASGLYTMRGLERRARELWSDAFRRHAPLACLALAVELEPQVAPPAPLAAPPVAVGYVGDILQARGRASDAIGRLGRNEFAGLAPSTAPEGAVRMARRLTQALETAGPRPPGAPPPLVPARHAATPAPPPPPPPPAPPLGHPRRPPIHARAAGSREPI